VHPVTTGDAGDIPSVDQPLDRSSGACHRGLEGGRTLRSGRPPRDDVPDAGRVIAGTARSIRLDAPGAGTRPLADRVKQTLFAILEPDLRGAIVLDLFAGSGAAGIEALSRGAAHATFVDRDARAIAVIHANLARTALAAGARASVVRGDALSWLRDRGRASGPPFDLAVVDPPYDEAAALHAALVAIGPLMRPGGRVVAKHFWRDAPPARVGLLASERQRRFGETALTFYRRDESVPNDTTTEPRPRRGAQTREDA
jgi:16S rRNA (guanine966-N2)-methyltransferase